MTTSLSWKSYISDLAKFTRLADLPEARRPISLRAVEQRLVDGAGALRYESQRATVLEQAVLYGSSRLVDTIAKIGSCGVAHLSSDEWHAASRLCSSDTLRKAVSLGLMLPKDWDVLYGIFLATQQNSSAKDFLTKDVAGARWWFPTYRDAKSRWTSLYDSELAVDFMRQQAISFSINTKQLLMCSHTSDKGFSLALQLSGVSIGRNNIDLADFVREQETAHQGIEVQSAFQTAVGAHKYLCETTPLKTQRRTINSHASLNRKLP
jgi:hypothetical protein